MSWHGLTSIIASKWVCGYCGDRVADNKGFYKDREEGRIYVCPSCESPTYFDPTGRQVPGPLLGRNVKGVPNEVDALYKEARNCATISAYTSVALACRKILMNIAVSQGADENQNFLSYVDYLADNGFMPPNGRAWVDHIRTKGNEATHEIVAVTNVDAEELLSFVELLLIFVYEFPSRVPQPN